MRDISRTGREASTVEIPARINEAGAAEAPDGADKNGAPSGGLPTVSPRRLRTHV